LQCTHGITVLNQKIRNPTKIQKHVLLLPSRSGKSYLYSKLASQKNYMVIDVDEFLKTCSSRDEIDRLDMDKKKQFILWIWFIL